MVTYRRWETPNSGNTGVGGKEVHIQSEKFAHLSQLPFRLGCTEKPPPHPTPHGLNTIVKNKEGVKKRGELIQIKKKSKHISFNCQDYSRARVLFPMTSLQDLLLCGPAKTIIPAHSQTCAGSLAPSPPLAGPGQQERGRDRWIGNSESSWSPTN